MQRIEILVRRMWANYLQYLIRQAEQEQPRDAAQMDSVLLADRSEDRRRDRSSSIEDVLSDEHQAEGREQSSLQSDDPPAEPRTSRQSAPSRGLQRTPTHSPQELEAYEARVERVRNVRMLKFKIKWMDALSDRARQQLQDIDPESLLEISPATAIDAEPLLSGEIDSNFPDRDLIAALEESYLETLSFFPGETALHGEDSPHNNELEAL